VLAHADTVPIGPHTVWDGDPFGGDIREGFLYGRGSGDDKCGMAIAAMLPLVARAVGIRPAGNLTIASVADEEDGGGNGVAALLAGGIRADAAVYLDGSNQTVWSVGLGGGFAEITVTAASRQRLSELTERTKRTILSLKAERKLAIIGHSAFGETFFRELMSGFFDIWERPGAALETTLTFLLDTLPGDDETALKRRVENALSNPGETLKIKWMSRFLRPSAPLPDKHPLIEALSRSFKLATGRAVKVGPGRQSDQGLVSHFGAMPCVLFGCGRRGRSGAPHQPNEHISLREFEENFLTMAFALFNRVKE
jgi:acetylornithine deacetylase